MGRRLTNTSASEGTMHEVSLGYTIRDYLSGREVEATTFEDLRQAIARLLVEEKGYPRGQIRSKVPIAFDVEGRPFQDEIDLVVFDQGAELPLLLVCFCFGDVLTFHRQTLAAARILPQGPARLVLVTDTKKADLLCVGSGEILRSSGYHSIPAWRELGALVKECPAYEQTEDRLSRERRIYYAFSEMAGCCGPECPLD